MTKDTRTGWPAGMLQDDSRELSRSLASKPDARAHVRDVVAGIADGPSALIEKLRAFKGDWIGDGVHENINRNDLIAALSPPTDERKALAEECKDCAREAISAAESAAHDLSGAMEKKRAQEARAELFAAIDALASLPSQAQEVPSGWKLVPIDPTSEMLGAAVDISSHTHIQPCGFDYWRAMLAAAPQPKEPKK